MGSTWSSYDAIASEYAAFAEPYYFRPPADDLVARLDLRPGMRFLDAGAGSGAVAKAARRAAGADALVVAIDPSLGMLGAWSDRSHRVAGVLPTLPLRDGSFDRAAAAFVLTHLDNPERGLDAIVGALVPRGRVGLTAWKESPGASEPGACFQEAAARFIDPAVADAAVASALPFESRFTRAEALEDLLRGAALREVAVEEKIYDVAMPLDAFVAARLLSMTSRFMAERLPPAEWLRFQQEVRSAISDRFGESLTFRISINFAWGMK